MNCKKKVIPLPFFSAFLTEFYLNSLCKKGLRLVSWRGIQFQFTESTQPYARYFVYYPGDMGFRRGDGKYSLTLRHPNIEKVYGLGKSASKLNLFAQRTSHGFSVVELSQQALSNIGYQELLQDRCRLYYRSFLRSTGLLYLALFTLLLIKLEEPCKALLLVSLFFSFICTARTMLYFIEKRVNRTASR